MVQSANSDVMPGHDGLTRALHWLSALGVVIAFVSMWLLDVVDDAWRDVLLGVHQTAGGTVLGLTVIRIVWRRFASDCAELGVLQRFVAQAVHLLLYVIMIVQPLLGWLYVSARGRSFHYVGIALPPLIGRNRALAETLLAAHGRVATILLVVIGVHASAALAHHFVLGDATLMRMLRGRVGGRFAGSGPPVLAWPDLWRRRGQKSP
jgi:cytochrome b561